MYVCIKIRFKDWGPAKGAVNSPAKGTVNSPAAAATAAEYSWEVARGIESLSSIDLKSYSCVALLAQVETTARAFNSLPRQSHIFPAAWQRRRERM